MKSRPKWIALDTMNYWIDGARPALTEVLKEIDILLINEAEAKSLAGETNLLKAAKIIASLGPKTLVIKRGEYGSLLVSPDSCIPLPAIPMETVIDPTGAGDTFAGGFLGYLASDGGTEEASLRKAMLVGTVMASFTIEDFGIQKLDSVSKPDIQDRLERFAKILGLGGI
jgi:sugar/nucleoside kinase (ribokinase family)